MKLVPMREGATAVTPKSADIVRAVLERAGPNGLTCTEIHARVRVLRALDKATPAGLLLEDGDHKTLLDALDAFRFGVASVELDQIITDIVEAKEPPRAAPQRVPDSGEA